MTRRVKVLVTDEVGYIVFNQSVEEFSSEDVRIPLFADAYVRNWRGKKVHYRKELGRHAFRLIIDGVTDERIGNDG